MPEAFPVHMRTYDYDSDYLALLADGWTRASFPLMSRLVRTTLEARLPRQILDFGAGAGAYAGVLSSLGGEVSACDVSDACVAACAGAYTRVFLVTNAGELPSGRYDMVFSTEVLEHIPDYAEALRHFHRALRPHGIVLLTTTAYSPSVFTMLYQAKGAGVGALGILRALGSWMAGYLSSKRRDRFVERWCFAPLGGHYHGFTKRELLRAFRSVGFTVEEAGVLYVIEPIQLPFLYSHTLGGLLARREWPKRKRCLAAAVFIVAHPLNQLMKSFNLFANNLYVVAAKGSDEHTG